MKLGKHKFLRAALSVMAAMMVLYGSLASSCSGMTVHAAESETEESTGRKYSLSYSYSNWDGKSLYYTKGTYNYSCDYLIFLYGDSNVAASAKVEYRLGVLNEDGVCELARDKHGVWVDSYVRYIIRHSDESINTTYKSDIPELSNSDNRSFYLYNINDDDSYYLCSGYVFKSLGDAQKFFDFGIEDGLVQRPVVVPDPDGSDDPEWDSDIDPDSFYGKILEMLRTAIFGNWKFESFLKLFSEGIFADWSFAKFLNLFNSVIFGDWSFTKFLNEFSTKIFGEWKFSDFLKLFSTAIFGNWSFEDFKDLFKTVIFGGWSFENFKEMFRTAIFGNWNFESIKKIIEEKFSDFSFQDLLNMIRTAMFGTTQKYKDIYDFFEEKTNGWDFNTIVNMIRENMFGFGKLMTIYDYFEEKFDGFSFQDLLDMIKTAMFGTIQKYKDIYDYLTQLFDEMGISTIAEDIKEMVRVALVGDPDHSLWAILFVPDDGVMEECLGEFVDFLNEHCPGIMKIVELGEHVIDTVRSSSGAKAPSFTIALGDSASYDLGNTSVTIDFSWYTPYKPMADLFLAGIIWVGFIWRMFSRIPEILSGAGMVVSMPFRMEHYEVQNARMKEARYRSDVRWESFLEAQARRRRK